MEMMTMDTPPVCGVHNTPMALDEPTDQWRCTDAACKLRIDGLQVYGLSQSRPGQPVVVMPERGGARQV
jgi:hypothetical protein